MRKIFFSLISLLLGILLFFWLLSRAEWQEAKNTFLRLSGMEVGLLLLLAILGTLLGAARWRQILKSKGCYFSLRELYGLYLASFAITYLAPIIVFGGEIFRGYVLNSRMKDSTPFKTGMAASFIDGIFEYAFGWLALLLGIASLLFTVGLPIKNLQISFFLIFLFLCGGLLGYFIFKKKSLLRIFFNVDEKNTARSIEKEVFTFFKIRNITFQKALLFSFFKTTLRFFQYQILLEFLGRPTSFLSSLSVLGVSVLSMALPISADLGTHDLGSAILFKRLGIGWEAGIVFATIVRGINLFLSIVGIFFLIKAGTDLLRRTLLKKISKISFFNNFNKKKIAINNQEMRFRRSFREP